MKFACILVTQMDLKLHVLEVKEEALFCLPLFFVSSSGVSFRRMLDSSQVPGAIKC